MIKNLRFNRYGDIVITEEDAPEEIVDFILKNNIDAEFAISEEINPFYISRAMYSGFYLTAFEIPFFFLDVLDEYESQYFPIYNIWKKQTVLFFDKLHESKSAKKLVKNYELRVNFNLEKIIDECILAHGKMWILPLRDALLEINKNKYFDVNIMSFEIYRDNELVAGEFGVKTGKIYTSYSGFYKESSAGSVQLLMMLRYLRDNNYMFCNFGTDDSERNNLYKRKLGAEYIDRELFISLWRYGRRL